MIRELHRRRVLELIDAFYAGDIEHALALCSDDVEFVSNAPVDILPHLGHHHGKDDVRQMWKTVHERYSSMRYELPFIAVEDDKVAVQLRAYFGKRHNGRIVQFYISFFFAAPRRQDRPDSRNHRHLRSDRAGGGAGRRRTDRRKNGREDVSDIRIWRRGR